MDDNLEALVHQGLTLAEIGQRLGGISRQRVHQKLNAKGWKTERASRVNTRVEIFNKNFHLVCRAYDSELLGIHDLAEAYSMSDRFVRKRLAQAGISIRTKSQSHAAKAAARSKIISIWGMLECANCCSAKPLDNFGYNSKNTGRAGRASRCRECESRRKVDPSWFDSVRKYPLNKS